ncbi:MAG TPA: DUF2007 domain-containing protein [Gaiellaceae bacterium]|nr:DUF2007 domain-containing protein [Gaiellaceae bacterium]
MSDPGGVKLTVVANRVEAEEVCGMLRANGIKCGYALSDMAGGIATVTGRVASVGPVDVYVEEEHLEDARKLLPSGG